MRLHPEINNSRADCGAPPHSKLSAASRLHQSRRHQPLREKRVGKAVPGLSHRVGAEWRGAHVGGQPHRSNALDGAAAASTVACTRGVAVRPSWSWSHQRASGPRVSGCPRAPRYFRPYPVKCTCVRGPRVPSKFRSGVTKARAVSGVVVRSPCTRWRFAHTAPQTRSPVAVSGIPESVRGARPGPRRQKENGHIRVLKTGCWAARVLGWGVHL